MLRRDFLDHGIEGTQEGIAADHEMCFGREGLEDTGKFNGDVAGADEDDFRRLTLELEEPIGSNSIFGAGDVVGDDGVAACTPGVNICIQLRGNNDTHQWQ